MKAKKVEKVIEIIQYTLPKVLFIHIRQHKVIYPIPWEFEIDYLKLKYYANTNEF